MGNWMIDSGSEPRCTGCDSVLVHAGAICVICDAEGHYEAPIRTAPPMQMPGADRGEDARSRRAG